MGRPSLFELHTLNLILVPTLSLHEFPGLRIDEELPLGTVVAQLTCEEIGPPTYSTSIRLSGQGSNLLGVVERSNLIVAERMNYESLSDNEREFNITATCSNQFEQTDSIVITVIINNINDNVFQFEHLRHTLVVSENLTIGEEVLMVSAEDMDLPNANITYSLEPASDFMITPHTGEIVSHSSLDRETQALYQFTVHAAYTNMTGVVERTSSSVTIHIADVNDESPIFEQSVYDVQNITDTNEPGDLVLIVSASDSDTGSGGTVTYHFSEESSNFKINETTGAILISSLLTYRLYVLNITAIDGGEDPMSSTALVFIHSSLTLIIVVDEDIPVGSVIGNVSYAILDNSNATLNDTSRVEVLFEIVNASVPFGINATTGEIYTLGSLDYETLATEYNFIVRATLFAPMHELINEQFVRIVVENVDDTPPVFSMSLYAATTEQFTGPNITILSVSAMDSDALNNTEYFLSGDNSSIFQIDPLTGQISATELLDVPKDYRFTVIAMDSGAGEANTSVFISVNAALVFITESFNFHLSESAPPGAVIGRVTDGFEDNTGEIAFLVGIADVEGMNVFTNISEGIFHIDATSGNISTLGMVDHESIEDYVFSVEMYNINTGTVYYTATVVVQIEDENDNPPVFMPSHYTRAIEETQEPNSIVTVLSATDRDSGSNGRVAYFFSEESMVAEFVLNSISGEISTSNSTLLPGLYHFTVVASDEGSPPLRAETTVFIDVIQFVPEAIEFSKQIYNFQVTEMAPPDTLIGVVQATEFNSALTPPSLTYSWPNITDCFSIDTQSGEIRVSCASLDRESVGDYELVVTAEVGNVTASAIVMVSVLDINDNTPEFSLDVYTEIINSTSNFTDAILQLLAVDGDFGDNGTVLYNIVSGTDEDIFWINSTSGEIFLVDDAIEVGDYVLIVKATDMGTPVNMSSNALVFIHITNPHPQTLRFANLFLNISENTAANPSLGFVVLETNEGEVVNPLDFPNDLHFSIIGEDLPGLFSVDEYTGEMRIEMTLDHEVAVLHVIEIQANFTRFDDVPIQSITASFTVTVLDENDNAPWILRTLATTIDDNAHGNQVLFSFTAMDIDSVPNAMVSFSVDSPDAFAVRVTETNPPFTFGEMFVNDAASLVAGVYQFTLTATDSGTPPMRNMTMVTVIVQHAIPEMIHFSSPNYTFSILEETPEGTPVGNVSVLPDTPALDGLVYGITGGSGREFFSIDVATGEIQKRSRRIDRERNSMFHLDLQVRLPEQDPPLTTTATVTIIIEDANDNAPVFSEAVYPSIGINTDELSTAIPLITVSATDGDTGSNADLWYSIASGFNETSVLFNLNGSTGELFPASEELMFGNYLLCIAGRDHGQPPLTGYSSVTIVVQRPAPTSISFTNPSGYTFSLQEQSGAATVAQVILSRIPEYLLQYVRYSTRGDADTFSIDSETGSISTQRNFDYEVDEREFSFEVIATLAVTHRIPPIALVTLTNVTVDIMDINDHSPYFINFPTEVTQYEGATRGEVVYSFMVHDGDSGSNSELRYALLNSTFNDALTVNPLSGQLVASANLDREGPLRDGALDLIIQVCDGGSAPRCVVNTTLFRLLDVNDNPPLLRSGFTYNVRERIPEQTHVFSFVGMDPDAGANGTIRYYLNSTTPFTCNEATGHVSLTRELDYEARASYRLELTLMDMGDPSLSTFYNNISVSVTNFPDNAPYFNQTSYSHAISATASADEVLFQVQATDADIGSSNDSLRYAITNIQVSRNGDYPRLEVRASTGEIVSEALQVFTPGAEFVISILAYDQSAFNLTNVTTLLIRVLYNSLAFTDVEYSVRVPEDAPLGSLIARLDLDPLSVTPDIRYAFSMIEPALQPSLIPFSLSSNGTSVLLTLDTQGLGLNRELIDRYVMEVTASQQNENAQTTLQVAVADVNDNSPMLVDCPETVIWISQHAALHTPVTGVNATDPDLGENSRLDFNIVGHNLNIPFEINRTTGVIRTRSALDTDGILPSYDITVCVRDSGQPRIEAYITYTINIGSIPKSTEQPAKQQAEQPTSTVFILVLTVAAVGLLLIVIASTVIITLVWMKKSGRYNSAELLLRSADILAYIF